jgi:hypothetical protein
MISERPEGVANRARMSPRLRLLTVLAGAAVLFGTLTFAPSIMQSARAETAAQRAKAKKGPRPAVTFTGFHVFADGSSRIWVRLTRTVNVEEHATRGKVTFVLKGAVVPGRNNKNPLITRHFTSSVMSARLLATKHDAELVVNLKRAVIPKHRIVSRPDGTTSVQIDFPAPLPGAEVFPEPEPPKAKPKADKGESEGESKEK